MSLDVMRGHVICDVVGFIWYEEKLMGYEVGLIGYEVGLIYSCVFAVFSMW